ncbi:MAG TPA: OB-fold nucleic acid binding domain-containing protein, partial [Anaerolineales bacterium]|nr:OB-fold nucleic acid binding domain-containing protein [Anaerolineales bacterium]
DRAISISASKFQAEELGQMSFFGSDSGLVQKITLPIVDPTYNRREQLGWERELVGLYVSDHPLREISQKLTGVITHLSGQLPHEENGSYVRVFGEVVRISKTVTKKGDEMAFVRLEDVLGFNKLVLFPRTWKKYAGILDYGRVVIAEGKLDNSRGEPSILVDAIKTEIPIDSDLLAEKMAGSNQDFSEAEKTPIVSAFQQTSQREAPAVNPVEEKPAAVSPSMEKSRDAKPVKEKPAEAELPVQTESAGGDRTPRSREIPNDFMPPEPEFPPDFIVYDDAGDEVMVEAEKKLEPAAATASAETAMAADEAGKYETVEVENEKQEESIVKQDIEERSGRKNAISQPAEVAGAIQEVKQEAMKPVLPVKPEQPKGDKRREKKEMVTVVMRSLGDQDRDILRMRRVYGMLISEPGEDRFAFYVIESDRGYRLEFPNDTTDLTEDMLRRIEELIGKENVIVEPITIQ